LNRLPSEMQIAPYRFQLLAPGGISTSNVSGANDCERDSYAQYLSSLQKLRAESYLSDGAITPERIDKEGRFPMHRDEDCWHFLLIDPAQEVIGCVRYLAHPATATVRDLLIGQSPLGNDPFWGKKFAQALESHLEFARRNALTFVEVGGWAINTAYRHTRAALEILLASFAWAKMIGGGIGCCTATVRNNSASMLRRIGGCSFEFGNEIIPPYNDPKYGCTMEALRFHFQDFDPRYQKMVDSIYNRIPQQPIIARSADDDRGRADAVHATNSLMALGHALHSANQTVAAPACVSVPS
jgi:hypothetical protein